MKQSAARILGVAALGVAFAAAAAGAASAAPLLSDDVDNGESVGNVIRVDPEGANVVHAHQDYKVSAPTVA